MFQRFKSSLSALDQTLANEQARQKVLSEQRANSQSPSGRISRTNSTRAPASRKGKKLSQDSTASNDGTPDTDPAVFEAAFALDEEEAEAKATAAKQDLIDQKKKADDTAGSGAGDSGKITLKDGQDGDKTAQSGAAVDAASGLSTSSPELPPAIKSKLRKLEKLEKMYPELLRSYRIAHGRATSIEPFERALRENTPLTSIRDPAALAEYLNQLNLKGDMVMDEFKRVSAEKDAFKKKLEDTEKQLASMKTEIDALKSVKTEGASATQIAGDVAQEDADKREDHAKSPSSPSESKSPVRSILGVFSPRHKPETPDENKDVSEDFFSYDDELPHLQAEVASKTEEITRLQSEVTTLKEELSGAKENSAELVASLETATRELGESRDKSAAQDSLQSQLDAKNVEIKTLTENIEQMQSRIHSLEATLEKERAAAASAKAQHDSETSAASDRTMEADKQLKAAAEAKLGLEKRVADLTTEIESLNKSKAESEAKIKDVEKQLKDAPTAVQQPAAPAPLQQSSTPTPAGGSKKKNKRKKKGGAANAGGTPSLAAAPTEATPSEASERVPPSPVESADTSALLDEISKLKDEIAEKDTRIERLSKQRKTEEDLREEIETMQEDLLAIGNEHVEAKQQIKDLKNEKKSHQERITELEKEVAEFGSSAQTSSNLHTEFDTLKTEYDELKAKSQSLTSDLGATQQLAQQRYKDLTELREVLAKAQPELKSLRQDSAALKATQDDLVAKQNEIRNLEKREKDLKAEVTRIQHIASDREAEIRNLNDRISAEAKIRAKLEDEKRVAGRDFRRSEAEKIELAAKSEKTARELEALQSELSTVRPRIQKLEDEVAALERERDSLKEEVDLKTAQYDSAQGLLGSMRDQTAELSIQLKESRSLAESLEEELGEVQKHLSERTREAETMRRMINEVDAGADAKVREMRTRMEAAVEERDRIEDESATTARRRAREAEDLKSKLRELERDLAAIRSEKAGLVTREKEWERRKEELEEIESKASAEVEDMRSAVANLRSALDFSEQQVREAEKQKADLRKLLDEARSRYERVAKDLKTAQAKLMGSPPPASQRSSMESSRSGLNGSPANAAGAGVDTMYLKTILLQFLEVKDEKVRSQLVPVLGKLLRFDKNDEAKWLNAVQHLAVHK